MTTLKPGEPAGRPAILVVDDEPAITRSLVRSLRDRFTVFTATTADEALEIIAREPIAVILTDQRMPDLSGVQLLEKARDLRPQAVGILISGYTDVSALVDALNLGNVRGFIPKPWDIQQLRHQLDEALHSYQVGFLDPSVLHRAANAATEARDQISEIQRTLDALVEGNTDALFAEWERIRSEPSPTASQLSFFAGPPADNQRLAQRMPNRFAEMVATYATILEDALNARAHGSESHVSEQLHTLSEHLGSVWATPRDVVEIHLSGMNRCTTDVPVVRAAAYSEEARMLLPELMGDLVLFYRGWLAAMRLGPRLAPPRTPSPPAEL